MNKNDLINLLLSKKNNLVNTKQLAREFGCSINKVAKLMKDLRQDNAVELINNKRWNINKDVLRKILAGYKDMKLNEYQKIARETAIYPDIGDNIVYTTLGLCGESGEFAEKIKKLIRDNNGVITPKIRNALIKELGDVLWYVANSASELDVTLEDVAALNLAKLKKREQENKLHGEGDDR